MKMLLFYYSFEPKNIADKYYEALSEESKNLLKEENIVVLINQFKFKTADSIFGDGNYNFALYKYALEKVCEEERKVKEEKEKEIAASQPKTSIFSYFEISKNSNMYLFITLGVVMFTMFLVGANYYFSMGGAKIINKPK